MNITKLAVVLVILGALAHIGITVTRLNQKTIERIEKLEQEERRIKDLPLQSRTVEPPVSIGELPYVPPLVLPEKPPVREYVEYPTPEIYPSPAAPKTLPPARPLNPVPVVTIPGQPSYETRMNDCTIVGDCAARN